MKTVIIGSPAQPSKFVTMSTAPAHTIFYKGNFGKERAVIIDREDDNYVYCNDFLTGDVLRIGHPHISEIAEVQVVRRVTDVTAHTNYHNVKCKAHIKTEWFVFSRNVVVEFNHTDNTGNQNGLYSVDNNVEK